MSINLETKLCGVKLINPTVLALGILGATRVSLKNVVEIKKSLCAESQAEGVVLS